MIIPFQSLPSETLNAIIEAFVLTEGTEYGLQEASLTDKIAQVKQQLVQKKAVLVYSELHQTVNILPAEQFAQNQFIDEQSDKSQN
ncbi:MAG: YheU family protein [Thalassotalea sp.]|nr:YheU family protein [Thalassotalea sp.]